LTTQKLDQVSTDESAKKAFVEPEISGPVDVLEATAFFQPITGGTDVNPDITG
jgi:hypothetical protein